MSSRVKDAGTNEIKLEKLRSAGQAFATVAQLVRARKIDPETLGH